MQNDDPNPARIPDKDSRPTPLQGLRVLDMSRVLAGPWCAQLLADFGAEVIKIERPRRGDDSRSWSPSFASTIDPAERQSAYFCSANGGKRSVTIDFSRPDGAELVRRLAARSDVLIENYKTGTLARHGLGYERLRALNPRLVYCSVTGFGQTGPYRQRAGYDTIIQAMGGMMSITGERDELPGGGPQRAGLPVIDLLTGVYAGFGILGALRDRDRSGEGQHLDLALLDVHVAALSYFGMNYLASGDVPRRMGNANPVTFPSGTFRAADGEVVILVGNDGQFARFCQTLGMPELARDPRFASSPDRVAHADELRARIAPALRARPRAHWIEALEAAGVPCAPINDLQAVFDDPQVRARASVRNTVHPGFGRIPRIANPIRMSASRLTQDRPAPLLGEDTDEILGHLLSLDAARIAALRAAGVI
ncbi:MAG: CaiB/BaiF CoA-transferase family protein [Burkholderiaceae bacterium]